MDFCASDSLQTLSVQNPRRVCWLIRFYLRTASFLWVGLGVTFREEGSDANSLGWLKEVRVVGGNSYLWGHSANCRNVIASADEVWSVDLQLKFT